MNLFYLNAAAKNNFTRNMGVQPVNFGSIFLYKNGFRIQPYGDKGDDSWGIDYRYQQGRMRFLGSRSLFGRVSIETNSKQFVEVSSRDGGLQKTKGYYELIKLFEKAHRALEKYVVGVLWGEGFKRRGFFGKGSDEEGERVKKARELLKADQSEESPKIAHSQIGSKLEYIQIIKGLASNDDVKILDYNKDLVNLVNEKIEEFHKPFADDLNEIATRTGDKDLESAIAVMNHQYDLLLKEKIAETKRADEEARRAKKAEEAELKATEKKKKAEDAKRQAELETLRKEKERAEEQLKRYKAEAEVKKKEEEKKVAEKRADEAEEQSMLLKSIHARDEQLHLSQHLIPQYTKSILDYSKSLYREISEYKSALPETWNDRVASVIRLTQMIQKLTQFNLHANFKAKTDVLNADLIGFINDYVNNVIEGGVLGPKARKVKVVLTGDFSKEFRVRFKPIRLSIILDNLFFNSAKQGASTITVNFKVTKKTKSLTVKISDDGSGFQGVDLSRVFDQGYTTTDGSGLGLFHVKELVEGMGGVINIEPRNDAAAVFIIRFKE